MSCGILTWELIFWLQNFFLHLDIESNCSPRVFYESSLLLAIKFSNHFDYPSTSTSSVTEETLTFRIVFPGVEQGIPAVHAFPDQGFQQSLGSWLQPTRQSIQ